MSTDEMDIIITLRDAIRAMSSSDITIEYSEMDLDLDLLSGSTKSHVKTAAEGLGYDIVLEGERKIVLHKRPSSQGRILRG